MTSSSQHFGKSTVFRVDPEHQLLEMMQAAVGRIHAAQINVNIHEDSVLLTGSVKSWYGKQHAQETLREISGSRVIQNNLQVMYN